MYCLCSTIRFHCRGLGYSLAIKEKKIFIEAVFQIVPSRRTPRNPKLAAKTGAVTKQLSTQLPLPVSRERKHNLLTFKRLRLRLSKWRPLPEMVISTKNCNRRYIFPGFKSAKAEKKKASFQPIEEERTEPKNTLKEALRLSSFDNSVLSKKLPREELYHV